MITLVGVGQLTRPVTVNYDTLLAKGLHMAKRKRNVSDDTVSVVSTDEEAEQGSAPPVTPVIEATPADIPRADDYLIHTSQEVDALMRAASDGKWGSNWRTDPQAATRSHSLSGLPHYVQLTLLEDEITAGLQIEALESLTLAQDPDFNFALLYVSRLLAPPAPLPPNLFAGGWVALDDVMEKIGWTPRSAKERQQMRKKIWDFLRFGARAKIIGQRTGEYHNKKTGERIETVIDGPPWAFMEQERPAQPKLFDAMEVPVRVQIVMSRTWTHLTTSPETTQYLPLGELLGAIPGNKPSGAWARVLGLALANFWRRQPRAALDGSVRPSRRELLERYTAKVAPFEEVLSGANPGRALHYWREALTLLVDAGFLAREGEAATPTSKRKEGRPTPGWQDAWLDEKVDLRPGLHMYGAVQACAESLPAYKPRALRSGKRRGRPPGRRSGSDTQVIEPS
jgi:hypothetical protein